jgi:hypothetical protein
MNEDPNPRTFADLYNMVKRSVVFARLDLKYRRRRRVRVPRKRPSIGRRT